MRELKNRKRRLHGDVEFVNPNICYCSSKPPKPDPAIGQAALQNANIAQQQLDAAKEQLAWNKEQAAIYNPLIQKVVDQQLAQSDTNQARADEQWNQYKNLFQPVESQMVQDAMGFDSQERKDRMAGQAAADVTQAYANTADQNMRNMGRLGVNPNSGRYDAIQKETSLTQAKDTAGAMNQARTNTELQGMAMRQGAAQFGRNMPSTGLAADSLALNAGNAATGNIAQRANINNANTAAAQNWFNGSVNSNNSAANIGLGQYGAQLQGWQANQDRLAGFGQLAGTIGGAVAPAIMSMLRSGGMIRGNTAYGLASLSGMRKPLPFKSRPGHLGMLKRKGYAEGGMIAGPGTSTSDSIPASIEGVQPIRLSNGEAVLNKAAVDLVGEDFVHRINAGGLMMLETQKGGLQ